MDGLYQLQFMLQQENFMCRLDLKVAYFSVPWSKYSRNMTQFQLMASKLYKFLCLCLVLGTAPRIFFKTFESSYINTLDTEHKDNNLPRQHASFREYSQRDSNGQRYSNFPVTACGLCSKSKKICIDTNLKAIIFKSNSRFDLTNIATDP